MEPTRNPKLHLQRTYSVNTLCPCGFSTNCWASRSFHAACEVFFDPFVRILDASNPTESREAAIGYTEGERLLFVVHVIRHEETIRIISAREATREERRQYENP